MNTAKFDHINKAVKTAQEIKKNYEETGIYDSEKCNMFFDFCVEHGIEAYFDENNLPIAVEDWMI